MATAERAAESFGSADRQMVTDVCSRWSSQIGAVVGRARALDELRVAPVKSSEEALCCRVDSDGGQAFLKVFRPGQDASYRRERDVLTMLKGNPVVPRHLAHCDDDRFVLSAFVDGLRADRGELAGSSAHLSYEMGRCLGRLDAALPKRASTGTWLSYLEKYDAYRDLCKWSPARDVLSEIPLCGMVLARCDAALSNFIVTETGAIVVVDFARSRFKPRGWDLVHAHAALLTRFPDRSGKDLDELIAGFADYHRGAARPQELGRVAQLLAMAQAGLPQNMLEGASNGH